MNLNEAVKLHDEDKLLGTFKISNEDYHAGPGISSTFLSNIQEYSVGHAKAWKEDNPVSDDMEFGSLVHMAVLEPELLGERYHVVPSTDKRTKEVQLIYSKAELEGWIPINQKTFDRVQAIRSALLSTNTGKALFSNGLAEQAYYTRDVNTGLLIKCKADYVNLKHKVLIDLKTIDKATIWNIKKKVREYGYRLQSKFYMDVINQAMKSQVVDSVVWAFVEKKAPHGIRFVEVKKEWLQEGFVMYTDALDRLHRAIQNNNYPLYEDKIIVIDEGVSNE